MSFERKRSLVLSVVVFFAIWPLVHHAAVRTLDLNPWKWFGWAMYTTPPRMIRLRAVDLMGRPLRWNELSGAQRAAADTAYVRFHGRRRELGPWAPPDAYARTLFAVFPEIEGVRIHVEERRVDRGSAALEVHRVSDPPYVYHRREFGD